MATKSPLKDAVRIEGIEPKWQPPNPLPMIGRGLFGVFQARPEIIRLAVMLYVRFPRSLRNVEGLLHECGVDVSHETIRYWFRQFDGC